ncbi:MAG: NTP transferase domain-containing protein [Candidatus Omnitrophica bacterium]|nr:NTP transferase domain-containing protein [Candidatus Omnitrophota bacterium]
MPLLSTIDTVILCGGLGKRLRSEIGETQKTMVDIDGEPFLDILLGYLAGQGLRRFILCTGYQSQEVEEYYRSKQTDFEVVFSKEQEPLGTGGAIKNAQAQVKGERFFALNGDCLCDLDYAKFLDFHLSKNAMMSIAVSAAVEKQDYGSIQLDDKGRVTSFQEKVEARPGFAYVNAGVYCFEKDVFSLMPEQDKFSVEEDFFAGIPVKEFFGFEIEKSFMDIGTPERLVAAKKKLK